VESTLLTASLFLLTISAGALKIKEMSYLHAEGYSGGALKHGPFALIEGKEGREGQTPVIVIILDDDHAAHMRTAAEEVSQLLLLLFHCIRYIQHQCTLCVCYSKPLNVPRCLSSVCYAVS
jgi:glucosamine 6-phosphate synthetase-like amidotransferase/phosphosugar isomerase protein